MKPESSNKFLESAFEWAVDIARTLNLDDKRQFLVYSTDKMLEIFYSVLHLMESKKYGSGAVK